jgi:hypothetical protein
LRRSAGYDTARTEQIPNHPGRKKDQTKMKNYFKLLLAAALQGAAQGTATAGDEGADLKHTGIAAGAGAMAAILAMMLGHTLTHPAAAAVIARNLNPIFPIRTGEPIPGGMPH